MLHQGLGLELRQDVNRIDAGVDEVGEDKVDDAVFAAEGDRRLGAVPGQRVEALAPSSRHHHAENFHDFTSGANISLARERVNLDSARAQGGLPLSGTLPYRLVVSASFSAGAGVICPGASRHAQLPSLVAGRFIPASSPRPSKSCMGTMAVSATDMRASRAISQWTASADTLWPT